MPKRILLSLLIGFAVLSQASPALADDLEIFGGQLVNIPPNVLVIFDTSGSMAFCTAPTSNSTCSNVSDRRISVAKSAITQLLTNTQNVNFGLMTFNNNEGGKLVQPCGTSNQTLISAVSGLTADGFTPLAETLAEAGLYFAGKRSWFNDTLYTNNNPNWYQNHKYVSPVGYDCQKNYVVLMTDGDPTYDDNGWLSTEPYIKGTTIGDYDADKLNVTCDGGDKSGELCRYNGTSYVDFSLRGTDYLDDVAYYLSNKKNFNNSLATLNASTQNEIDVTPIRTYTIGFSSPATATGLLTDTAGNGGGTYYSATNAIALQDAFKEILSSVLDANATYVAPAIPKNPDNQIASGNKAYLAFFKPTSDGRWIGNLKGYTFLNGELLDNNDAVATYPMAPDANNTNGYVAGKEGYIKPTAQSYWSSSADGLEVGRGGVGELLKSNTSRHIYTFTYVDAAQNYIDTSNNATQRLLTQQLNEFKATTNGNLEDLLRDIYGATSNPDTYINLVRNGVPLPTDADPNARWYLGDIVHSEPSVYGFNEDCNGDNSDNPDDYVFVGANDGMLHVFCGERGLGAEQWAFVPPKQLSRLHLLNNGEHTYFVDGSPIVESITNTQGTYKLLVFGEGRGGERYYALDVSTISQPRWKYQVTEHQLQDSNNDGFADDPANARATLGQAWATPQRKRVRYLDNTVDPPEKVVDVFLLAGGYDARYETEGFPGSVPQTPEIRGRAIYTIDALTGDPVGPNFNGNNWSAMKHSVVDVTGFDSKDRGYIDRIYAGDLGGNLIASRYDKEDDLWERFVRLDLPDGYKILSPDRLVGETLYADKNCASCHGAVDVSTKIGFSSADILAAINGGVASMNGISMTSSEANAIALALSGMAPLSQKFMTRPEATLEKGGECVYIGTGDREHLLNTNSIDALYVVCNRWEKDVYGSYKPVAGLLDPVLAGVTDPTTEMKDKLVDITTNKIQDGVMVGTLDEKLLAKRSLEAGSGWFLRMEHPGEKVTSSPIVFDGTVYFTTFTPGADSALASDPCTASFDLGVARLYAVDYRTGAAVFNFDGSDDEVLTKTDRSTVVGTGVATLYMTTEGEKTYVNTGSTGGQLQRFEASSGIILKRYYWRQIK